MDKNKLELVYKLAMQNSAKINSLIATIKDNDSELYKNFIKEYSVQNELYEKLIKNGAFAIQ